MSTSLGTAARCASQQAEADGDGDRDGDCWLAGLPEELARSWRATQGRIEKSLEMKGFGAGMRRQLEVKDEACRSLLLLATDDRLVVEESNKEEEEEEAEESSALSSSQSAGSGCDAYTAPCHFSFFHSNPTGHPTGPK